MRKIRIRIKHICENMNMTHNIEHFEEQREKIINNILLHIYN